MCDVNRRGIWHFCKDCTVEAHIAGLKTAHYQTQPALPVAMMARYEESKRNEEEYKKLNV